MLTKRYMTSMKNLSAIMAKIVDGTAPRRFTIAHLKSIGFKSSNDQGVLPLLKDLGFLTDDGVPTKRYHDYRDKSSSKVVMAEALREAYEDLFHINERPSNSDRSAIEGKFKSEHNVSDRVASESAKTFFALLSLADLDSTKISGSKREKPDATKKDPKHDEKPIKQKPASPFPGFTGLRYNVEIHLPATKDVEVYNAIFKSIKEHLLED